jgi:hypothetical protein
VEQLRQTQRIHEMHDMVSAMYNYYISERHFWHDEWLWAFLTLFSPELFAVTFMIENKTEPFDYKVWGHKITMRN